MTWFSFSRWRQFEKPHHEGATISSCFDQETCNKAFMDRLQVAETAISNMSSDIELIDESMSSLDAESRDTRSMYFATEHRVVDDIQKFDSRCQAFDLVLSNMSSKLASNTQYLAAQMQKLLELEIKVDRELDLIHRTLSQENQDVRVLEKRLVRLEKGKPVKSKTKAKK